MENSKTNSANSANQPSATAETSDIPARARARRKIDASVISAIARLCAKSLTESEACRLIGIEPRHWFDWKSRASRSEKFAALLEEFRAGRIDSLIAKIENAADGIGLKQPDWRSAAFLLSLCDKRRFGQQADAPPPPPMTQMIGDAVIIAILDKLYAPETKPVVIQDAVDVPALPEHATLNTKPELKP